MSRFRKFRIRDPKHCWLCFIFRRRWSLTYACWFSGAVETRAPSSSGSPPSGTRAPPIRAGTHTAQAPHQVGHRLLQLEQVCTVPCTCTGSCLVQSEQVLMHRLVQLEQVCTLHRLVPRDSRPIRAGMLTLRRLLSHPIRAVVHTLHRLVSRPIRASRYAHAPPIRGCMHRRLIIKKTWLSAFSYAQSCISLVFCCSLGFLVPWFSSSLVFFPYSWIRFGGFFVLCIVWRRSRPSFWNTCSIM